MQREEQGVVKRLLVEAMAGEASLGAETLAGATQTWGQTVSMEVVA